MSASCMTNQVSGFWNNFTLPWISSFSFRHVCMWQFVIGFSLLHGVGVVVCFHVLSCRECKTFKRLTQTLLGEKTDQNRMTKLFAFDCLPPFTFLHWRTPRSGPPPLRRVRKNPKLKKPSCIGTRFFWVSEIIPSSYPCIPFGFGYKQDLECNSLDAVNLNFLSTVWNLSGFRDEVGRKNMFQAVPPVQIACMHLSWRWVCTLIPSVPSHVNHCWFNVFCTLISSVPSHINHCWSSFFCMMCD